MGRKEVIEKIKLAESEARAKIEDAAARKARALEDARSQSKRLGEESDLKTRGECDATLAAAKDASGRERNALIQKGKTDADSMKKKADIPRAKELFVSRFEEQVR